jgi:hypothetical protein
MKTVFLDTPEMAFLTRRARWNLSEYIKDPGTIDYKPMTTNISLKDTLERLFENVTMSLLSSPDLQ